MNGDCSEILKRLEAIAFSRSNDAVKLAFTAEQGMPDIDQLDLGALAELKRLSNGSVEMKFIDRIKVLELMTELRQASAKTGTAELMAAINSAADRLPGRSGDGTETAGAFS